MSARAPIASDRLAGLVAVVFGGGSPGEGTSIGQAAALAYAAAGASVAIVDAKVENEHRTAALIERSLVVQADISVESEVAAAVNAAVARFGRIDILHNNVGLPITGAFEGFDATTWVRGLSINCVGAAQAIRFALPHLIAARGAIVNVSSIAGIRHTGMDYAIYNSAKAALDQMTVAVALEFANRGVRANAILPGLIDTDMGRSLADFGDSDERHARSPTGRQGEVWDVANAAVFLASSEASYINGHLLVVDGGLSRRC